MIRTPLTTLITIILMHSGFSQISHYKSNPDKYPKPLSEYDVKNCINITEKNSIDEYIELYEEPDIKIQWNFNLKLPERFVDEVFKNGIEDAGRFFNLFF